MAGWAIHAYHGEPAAVSKGEPDAFTTHRQCTITISNHSSYSLMKPSLYVSSGSCTKDLPDEIVSPSGEATVEFQKTPGAARGAVAVFTYELHKPRGKSHNKKLAVMFSVPFNYNWYKNWYAVGFFDKNKACDQDLFNEMYYNPVNGFARQKGGCPIDHPDVDLRVTATMTDTYTPVMTVDIYDK